MEEQEVKRSRSYWFFNNIGSGLRNRLTGFFKKHPVWAILILLILLYTLFVSRAGLQPFVLIARKYILLVAIVLFVFWRYIRKLKKSTWKQSIVPTLLFVGLLAVSFFFGPPVYRYVSLYFHYNQVKKVRIVDLPESDFERIQPVHSIRTLINQEALSETEDATPPKFVRNVEGGYDFVSAVGPSREYKIQQLSKDMYEILHVPALLPSPVFSGRQRDDVEFEVGELLLFSKNTDIAVIKSFGLLKYLSYEPGEPVYIEKEKGNWVQVVPLIKWKGILFPRPVFGGVVEIEQKSEEDSYIMRVLLGKGKYIQPNGIQNYDYLRGQNLMPVKVADFIAESFRFANGFFAPFPGYHEGDIRIPSYKDAHKAQPFVVHFKMKDREQLFNYYGLEPYQESKKGLSLSLLIPGDSDAEVYYVDHREGEDSYIGSSAISAKIIESKKNYDWDKNYPAESRPYVRKIDGKIRFFWLSTIVTRAGEGESDYISGSIPEICLTDAVYGKVVWIDQDSLTDSKSWMREAERELKGYWE
ncbi:hypothetical protein GYB22_05565 [bacterium]|nr:hypothetical protein [bacterium]